MTEQFKALLLEQKVIESEVVEAKTYVGLNYTVEEFNGKLCLYLGEVLTTNVKFINGKTIETKRIAVSSDT